MEKTTALDELTTANSTFQLAEVARDSAAYAARADGATWNQIGLALGITKQRAQQRYGDAEGREQTARRAAAVERGRAEAERILAEIHERHWGKTEDPAKISEPDVAGASVTPSIFLDPIAPAKSELPATDTWTEPRKHGAILPGPKPKTAQPGTGKGPHLCPGCQSTNHHGSKRNTIVWNDGCIPTKYDTPAETDYLNGLTK